MLHTRNLFAPYTQTTPHVLVLGGGMTGLIAGMLLARDGLRVTLVERDPDGPPGDVDERARSWGRRGVNQFRLPHACLPRLRHVLEAELPDVAQAMRDGGCMSYNILAELPQAMTGGLQPGDERFEMVTGRRGVFEGVVADCAARTPGLTIRRGVAVAGLIVDHTWNVPHVCGVRTTAGEAIRADLVVDVMGRRSPLTELLVDAGVRRPLEEVDDVGFLYYSRDFRNDDGSLPALLGPANQPYESLSILTLPADRGNWSVVITTSNCDRLLRAASDVDVWQRIVEQYPLARHWTEADRAGDVTVLGKLEDRRRSLVVDGRPVATGVVQLGDAWACTNPSVGRGMSIGALHAVELRDHLREHRRSSPLTLAAEWVVRTEATVGPWWEETHAFDAHRLREIDAQIAGEPYLTDDPAWGLGQALGAAAAQDPAMLRHLLDIVGTLEHGVDVLGRPGVAERALALLPTARPLPGPSRGALVDLLRSSKVGAA